MHPRKKSKSPMVSLFSAGSAYHLLILIFATCLTAFAQTNFSIHFDQTQYWINPGETFSVDILIDPVPSGGLYSSGVAVFVSPANATFPINSAISAAVGLDFNSVLGPGAIKDVGDGFAAIKGTVDSFGVSLVPYGDTLLANCQITDLGAGPYTLQLALWKTLGPTEEVFVDGSGATLDPLLTFGTATVFYTPSVTVSRLSPEDSTASRLSKDESTASRLSPDDSTIRLTWNSVAGVTYRIQYKNSLKDPVWVDLPGDVNSTGTVSVIDIQMENASNRFYRVEVLF